MSTLAEEASRRRRTRTSTMVVPQQSSRGPMSGVVALVEVGSERRALPLRAALTALGASVVAAWSPLVTHLVWAQDGNPKTRARARALAAHVVSPLWVEASAATARRECERSFPTAARRSDLPSPRTLIRLLERAEIENVPLVELLSPRKTKQSSESPVESVRINMAPRRALPLSVSPLPLPTRGRRKLFVQRETISSTSSSSSSPTPPRPRRPSPPPFKRLDTSQSRKIPTKSQSQKNSTAPRKNPTTSRKNPATSRKRPAGPQITPRQGKGLARAERRARRIAGFNTQATQILDRGPTVIVLTALRRSERADLCSAIKSLGGQIATKVTKLTSHVLVGPLSEESTPACPIRTLNALLGAVRGCHVLKAQYVVDSLKANKWLHHLGYEVAHLKKISERARVERNALGCIGRQYFYDIFFGTKVRVAATVAHADEAKRLLTRCGAICCDDGDITIGDSKGQVQAKWVFDSVMAGRMRNTRRYLC